VIVLNFLVASYAIYYTTPKDSFPYIISKNLLMPLGNLSLLLYFILSRVIPNLMTHLKARRTEIAEGILDFTQRNNAIAQNYQAIKEKLHHLDDEKKEILAFAKERADEETQEIRQQIDHKIERRLQESKARLNQEALAVQSALQRQLIEQAFADAQSQLTHAVNAQDQERLEKESLEQLGGLL
jgi:F0F1-type ATP synthase membrane subunit b/b'